MSIVPNFPGKSVVAGAAKSTRVVAGAAGNGCLAAGRFVVKHVLHHDEEKGANADPIAQATTAPPGAERKPTPKPKPAKPKAAKPKATRLKPAKPKTAKPKPAKPKAESEEKPKRAGKGPHAALNNPVEEPDETEYPDPYDKRPDPRDPVDPDGEPFGEEPHPATGAESTSGPPLELDPEVGDRAKPPKRENLDQ